MSKSTSVQSSNASSWYDTSHMGGCGFSHKRERSCFREVWNKLNEDSDSVSFLVNEEYGIFIPSPKQSPEDKRDCVKACNFLCLLRDILVELEVCTLGLSEKHRVALGNGDADAAEKYKEELLNATVCISNKVLTMMTSLNNTDLSDIRRALRKMDDDERVGVLLNS